MIKRLRSLEATFSLSKAAIIVGVFTLLSRLVGFARDILFASRLAPGDTLDIYYASFRVPDLVFNLLILGTLSVAFIPVFTEVIITDKRRAMKIANTILNASGLFMVVCCLLLFVFARELTHLTVPGFTGAKFDSTVMLTRLFMVSPIIFTLSNVFSSILQSYKKFLLVSLAPILYNFGIIFGLVFLYPRFGLIGWGIGVIAGACMHLAVQVPAAYAQGFSWQPVMDFRDEAVRRIGTLFIPRIFGLDIGVVSLFIATIVGSLLPAGTISVFNLANNLQAVPLGIFALSIAVAVFPVLSEFYAQRDDASFMKTLSQTMVQILFFMIPISILMLLLRAYIVRIGFGHGKFDWEDTVLTFTTFGVFSISLFSQGLVPLLARAFYARQNTKIPVYAGLAAMALDAVLAYFLGRRYGVVGLAGAFTIANIFNAVLLFVLVRETLEKQTRRAPELIYAFDEYLIDGTVKILGASVVMGLVSYMMIYIMEPLVDTRTFAGILVQAGVSGILGVAAFLGMARLLEIKQAKPILDFLGKLW